MEIEQDRLWSTRINQTAVLAEDVTKGKIEESTYIALADGYESLGHLDMASGALEECLRYYPESEGSKYRLIQIRQKLAMRHLQGNDLIAAYANLRRLLVLDSNDINSKINLGVCLSRMGKKVEAVQWYSLEVLKDEPAIAANKLSLVYLNLGATLIDMSQCTLALPALAKALELAPGDALALANLSGCHFRLGHLGEALRFGELAKKATGAVADGFHNLAVAQRQAGLIDESLENFGKALPAGKPETTSGALMTLNYTNIGRDDSRRRHMQGAKAYQCGKMPYTRKASKRAPGDPVRVGYVSGDFRRHSVAYFMLPLLKGHKAIGDVEAVCYHNYGFEDEVTKEVRARCKALVPIAGLSDDDVCAQVTRDHIDILVDLSGHTEGNRLGVFARRPCAVQATYLGYPNTTGLPEIGWRITDWEADPEGSEKAYTEKLLRVKGGFLAYGPTWDCPGAAPSAPSPAGRKPVYGCFNALGKITPEVLATWAVILRKTDGHLLVKAMGAGDQSIRDIFYARAKAAGIAGERLSMMGYSQHYAEHMDINNAIDVALDTWPYNGTTTTCEALYMGIPVVTLEGSKHAGRVGHSLVVNSGCGVSTRSRDEYIFHACRAERMIGQRERFEASYAMDGKRLAKALGKFYKRLLAVAC
jgi:predicted O-linked N-acetylglucosamine transferase (SPINDLY family)